MNTLNYNTNKREKELFDKIINLKISEGAKVEYDYINYINDIKLICLYPIGIGLLILSSYTLIFSIPLIVFTHFIQHTPT